MSLLCPKCMNPMRQYERNRVVVDQCVECGGLFLDRGELESLGIAERAYYGDVPQAAVAAPGHLPGGVPAQAPGHTAPIYDERRYDQAPRDDRYRDYGERRYDDQRAYDDRYYGKSKKRRARSFLEELFDD